MSNTSVKLPFGMIHQEPPSMEIQRGYKNDSQMDLEYDVKLQMNRNFSIQMARTWSMVTSSGAIFVKKDPDNQEDDGK